MGEKALGLLRHVYEFAELYTVAFAWFALPLGAYALYRFVKLNEDLFEDF